MTTNTTHGGLVKEDEKMISVHFDSVLEVLDHNCDNVNRKKFIQYTQNEKADRYGVGSNWLGTTNQCEKDVINHALAGDPEMCKDLMNKISQFRIEIGADRADYRETLPRRKRKTRFGDFGDEVDIHKVLAGKVDTSWRKKVQMETNPISPLVTIVIDLCASAYEDCKNSYWRAAVALFVTQELLNAGKSVKLVVADVGKHAMHDSRKLLSTSIVIKDFNQAVSIERIAAMTHLGFFRTFMFGAMQVQDYATNSSLGTPVTLDDNNIPVHLREEVEKGHTKYLRVTRISSLREAQTALKDIYKQIGEYRN